jgi:hypothetical protein
MLFNAAPFSTARKAFLAVGNALEAGDVEAAQSSLAEFQKNVPSREDTNNPVAKTISKLSQALDSGDLATATSAYADAKAALARKPQQGSGTRGQGTPPAGGTPPGGSEGANSLTAAKSGISTKTYDVRDTNEDGRVSIQEELAYAAQHIIESVAGITPSSGNAPESGSLLNVQA